MSKPQSISGYDADHTGACERVLVTLLRHLGPWKESVYLVGGLTPRYLVPDRDPAPPAHAGTLDVDVVVDLALLTTVEAYQTLEQNLNKIGFERGENGDGVRVSWRWVNRGIQPPVVLELLVDAPDIAGGRVEALPAKGGVSALNVPHSSMVVELHSTTSVTAELLGEDGKATEAIRHADLVAFTCLKAFAFDDRKERKDAHDLAYCLKYATPSVEDTAALFVNALGGKHANVVRDALSRLRDRFADTEQGEGFEKDGCVAVAKFELGESTEPEERERRLVRQREVADLVSTILARVEHAEKQ